MVNLDGAYALRAQQASNPVQTHAGCPFHGILPFEAKCSVS